MKMGFQFGISVTYIKGWMPILSKHWRQPTCCKDILQIWMHSHYVAWDCHFWVMLRWLEGCSR